MASLLIFLILVLILTALALYAVRLIPLPQPFSGLIQALVVLVAIVVIAQRMGVL